jgi:hypothetical protein
MEGGILSMRECGPVVFWFSSRLVWRAVGGAAVLWAGVVWGAAVLWAGVVWGAAGAGWLRALFVQICNALQICNKHRQAMPWDSP